MLHETVPISHWQDGLIHKDEFALALFKTTNQSNLFIDKVGAPANAATFEVSLVETCCVGLALVNRIRSSLEAPAAVALMLRICAGV